MTGGMNSKMMCILFVRSYILEFYEKKNFSIKNNFFTSQTNFI